MTRRCMHCGQPEGSGARELRPYGPRGGDVCAECTFNGPPEREAEARRQLGARLLDPAPMVLDPSEQVGPRAMTSGERVELLHESPPCAAAAKRRRS